METYLLKVLGIVLVDLVLSGDNVVVIAMAVRDLAGDLRRQAILVGVLGAVILRVVFTALAALLLGLPLLRGLGGLALFWIAGRLLAVTPGRGHRGEANSFWSAVGLIIMADFMLSLDNVLAVAGTANGHLGLLVLGLVFSIPLLMIGSTAVARWLSRWPWLVLAGGLVIIWAGGQLIAHDLWLRQYIHLETWQGFVLGLLLTYAFMRGDLSGVRATLRK